MLAKSHFFQWRKISLSENLPKQTPIFPPDIFTSENSPPAFNRKTSSPENAPRIPQTDLRVFSPGQFFLDDPLLNTMGYLFMLWHSRGSYEICVAIYVTVS